jgi:hypothetical protein
MFQLNKKFQIECFEIIRGIVSTYLWFEKAYQILNSK